MFNMQNSYTAVNIAHKIVKKSKKYGSHTAPSYSYSLSVCQIKCVDDRASFNVICDMCDV